MHILMKWSKGICVSALMLFVFNISCTEDNTDLECRLSSDCPAGEQCESGRCIEVDDIEDVERCTEVGCPCNDDVECAVSMICDVASSPLGGAGIMGGSGETVDAR